MKEHPEFAQEIESKIREKADIKLEGQKEEEDKGIEMDADEIGE